MSYISESIVIERVKPRFNCTPHNHNTLYWVKLPWKSAQTLPNPRVPNNPSKPRWADDTLDLLTRHSAGALLRGALYKCFMTWPFYIFSCWCSHWSPTQWKVTWVWWNRAMFEFCPYFGREGVTSNNWLNRDHRNLSFERHVLQHASAIWMTMRIMHAT